MDLGVAVAVLADRDAEVAQPVVDALDGVAEVGDRGPGADAAVGLEVNVPTVAVVPPSRTVRSSRTRQ